MYIIYSLLCILKDINQIYFQNNICLVICGLATHCLIQYKNPRSLNIPLLIHTHPTEPYVPVSLSQEFAYISQEWFHKQTLISI